MPPAPSASVRVEGPPPGLAQGRYDVPQVVIVLVGGALLVVGLSYLALRFLLAHVRRSE